MAVNPEVDPGQLTNDPIVNKVIDIIVKRHMEGMEKFGVSMENRDKPFDAWIDDTVEELLDAIHYLVKARSIVDKFKSKQEQLEKMVEQFKENTFTEKDNEKNKDSETI
tara:strand:+ start:561 stop:887 length:327 start_codon:yes stop_codon:yes gene_type:complete